MKTQTQTQTEALKLALEALEQLDGLDTETECVTIDVGDVIDAIKEALAQPEQKPVGYWMGEFNDGAATLYEVPQESVFGRTYRNMPVYTTPPQRKLLTNEQIGQAVRDAHIAFCLDKHQTYEHALTRAIEAAHNIKENT